MLLAADGSSSALGTIGLVIGVIGALGGFVTAFLARRSSRDANEAANRAVRVDEKLADLQILSETVDVLQEELARVKLELVVERSNRVTLERFVREHLPPELELPTLRIINGGSQ